MDYLVYSIVFAIISIVFWIGFYFAFRTGVKKEMMILIIPSIILFISAVLSMGLMIISILKCTGIF